MEAEINETVLCLASGEFKWHTFVLSGLVTTLLVIVGIPNCIRGYRSLRMRRNSRLVKYLRVLCLWDATLIITAFSFYALFGLIFGHFPYTGWPVYLYTALYPLSNFAGTNSLWLVVTISIERYLALRQPITHRARGSGAVYKICICPALFSLGLNVFTAFEYSIWPCWHEDGEPDIEIAANPISFSRHYVLIYQVLFHSIFLSPLPFLVVAGLTLNTISIQQQSKRTYQRTQSYVKGLQEKFAWGRLAGMLFKFLLCYSAPTTINILELVSMTEWVNMAFFWEWAQVASEMSNLIVLVHSATNWWVFHSQRDKFSKEPTNEETVEAELFQAQANTPVFINTCRRASSLQFDTLL